MTTRLTPDEAMDALAALSPADEDLAGHWYIGRREHNVQTVLARAATPTGARTLAPRRRPRAWWIAVPAAVATATAVILLLPGAISPRPIEAVPVQTPAPTVPATPAPAARAGEWVETTPSPLSPRHDSLALWVDDSFLVIGGASATPCALDVDNTCHDVDAALRDGALYNPETNQWRRIADAPEPIYVGLNGPASSSTVKSAAVGRTLYTLSQYWGFLAYDLDTDTWQRLPDAPFNKVSVVSAWGDAIVAFPFASAVGDSGGDPSELVYEVFLPSTGTWTLHTTGQKMPSAAAMGVAVGDTLVVSAAVDGDDPDNPLEPTNSTWVALVDLPSGEVTIPSTQPISTGVFDPVALPNGLVAWPRAGWILDLTTQAWASVAFPDTVGPLAGGTLRHIYATVDRPWPITTAGLVALQGHLYDPATGLWSRNDERPGPRLDTVYVGGDPGILACWGYTNPDDAAPSDACHFLRPASATSTTPE